MDKQTLDKANRLYDQIERITKEVHLLENGDLRCDLASGEGARWEPISGIEDSELREVITDRLIEKKNKLTAQLEEL